MTRTICAAVFALALAAGGATADAPDRGGNTIRGTASWSVRPHVRFTCADGGDAYVFRQSATGRQTGPASVTDRGPDADGAPPPGVSILRGTCDARGRFEIHNVPDGRYWLVARYHVVHGPRPGHAAVEQNTDSGNATRNGIVVHGGETRTVNLDDPVS